jgi:hypothetical protein
MRKTFKIARLSLSGMFASTRENLTVHAIRKWMRHSFVAGLFMSVYFQFGCAHRIEAPVVPPGFNYYEPGEDAGISVVIDEPLEARQVAGTVRDTTGGPIEKALVEITKPDRGPRISARFTDQLGRFEFPNLGPGEYPIEITKYGFARLFATLKVSKSGPRGVTLTLQVGT